MYLLPRELVFVVNYLIPNTTPLSPVVDRHELPLFWGFISFAPYAVSLLSAVTGRESPCTSISELTTAHRLDVCFCIISFTLPYH